MRDSDHFGRPIRTIADVRVVLDSPRASFEEYLNCVYVCVAESAWDLYENASRMALEAAISAPRIQVPNLIEAAEHLVKAIMRRAEDLSDLGPRANEAMDLGAGALERGPIHRTGPWPHVLAPPIQACQGRRVSSLVSGPIGEPKAALDGRLHRSDGLEASVVFTRNPSDHAIVKIVSWNRRFASELHRRAVVCTVNEDDP